MSSTEMLSSSSSSSSLPMPRHSVHTLLFRSLKRTHDMFVLDRNCLPMEDKESEGMWRKVKARNIYGPNIIERVHEQRVKGDFGQHRGHEEEKSKHNEDQLDTTEDYSNHKESKEIASSRQLTSYEASKDGGGNIVSKTGSALAPLAGLGGGTSAGNALQMRKPFTMPKPSWHAPWKLYRVISGHTGWVRCVAVEPGNQWFCTGAADRVIKIWDLAKGTLKLSLTGHVSTVRGLAVSPRQPYLFSCGEDRMVKCWDLEYNKVIRHYHGHLSAVYGLALHPTIDVLVTCGRDSVARVWDMRTKVNVHVLTGHTSTVSSVLCQATEPQVITGSNDQTIRLWDLAAGRSMATLTNHKKSVRAMVAHPVLNMFASGSADNIKEWKCPEGKFIQNLTGHNAIINCMAANADGVLVSGADNGTMHLWDWKTGYNFQRVQAPVQPGSLDSEAGIFAMCFDGSGSRLITGEADKTIKLYKEDEEATEETHPINWKPDIIKRKRY